MCTVTGPTQNPRRSQPSPGSAAPQTVTSRSFSGRNKPGTPASPSPFQEDPHKEPGHQRRRSPGYRYRYLPHRQATPLAFPLPATLKGAPEQEHQCPQPRSPRVAISPWPMSCAGGRESTPSRGRRKTTTKNTMGKKLLSACHQTPCHARKPRLTTRIPRFYKTADRRQEPVAVHVSWAGSTVVAGLVVPQGCAFISTGDAFP